MDLIIIGELEAYINEDEYTQEPFGIPFEHLVEY